VTEYAWADRGAATSLELGELAELLVMAHELETGERPAKPLAELELAQILLETNRTRSMWLHNWGNITAGAQWKASRDFWRPSWYELGAEPSERDRVLHQAMLEHQAPEAFRGYPDHLSGARDYVRHISGSISEAGTRGDTQAFARAVRERYCPDCTEKKGFSASLDALREVVRRAGVLDALGLVTPRQPSSGGGLGMLGALGVLWFAARQE